MLYVGCRMLVKENVLWVGTGIRKENSTHKTRRSSFSMMFRAYTFLCFLAYFVSFVLLFSLPLSNQSQTVWYCQRLYYNCYKVLVYCQETCQGTKCTLLLHRVATTVWKVLWLIWPHSIVLYFKSTVFHNAILRWWLVFIT